MVLTNAHREQGFFFQGTGVFAEESELAENWTIF